MTKYCVSDGAVVDFMSQVQAAGSICRWARFNACRVSFPTGRIERLHSASLQGLMRDLLLHERTRVVLDHVRSILVLAGRVREWMHGFANVSAHGDVDEVHVDCDRSRPAVLIGSTQCSARLDDIEHDFRLAHRFLLTLLNQVVLHAGSNSSRKHPSPVSTWSTGPRLTFGPQSAACSPASTSTRSTRSRTSPLTAGDPDDASVHAAPTVIFIFFPSPIHRPVPLSCSDVARSTRVEATVPVPVARPPRDGPQREPSVTVEAGPGMTTLLGRRWLSASAARRTKKVFPSAEAALQAAGLRSAMTILVGGFGICGIPMRCIDAINARDDVRDLTVVSNNCGVDDWGLGVLLRSRKIRTMIASVRGRCARPPPAADRTRQVVRRRERRVRAAVPRRRAVRPAGAPGDPGGSASCRRRRSGRTPLDTRVPPD